MSASQPLREHKGKNIIAFLSDYIAIDIETTGLDPKFSDIIELSAALVRNDVVINCYQTLVNPGYEIDKFIEELTGITNSMLKTAPTISEVLESYLKFIGNNVVLGHNINFDINFIYDNCINTLGIPFRNDFIDTMRLSRKLFSDCPHHRLIDLVTRFNISENIEHRALSDAMCAKKCYDHLKNYVFSNHIDQKELCAKKSYAVKAKDIKTNKIVFDEDNPIYKKTFVFTGTLEKFTRAEAMKVVVDFGGVCGDNVTRTTNYLVLGNLDYCRSIKGGKSNKLKKAEQIKLSGGDIEIISENLFLDMAGSE